MTTTKPKIKSRSNKRAKQEREYLKLRKAFLILYPICQVKECNCEATTVHHMRGRTGELLTNVEYFLAVCWPHHNYIENHPKEAKEHGYSLSRLAI